MKFSILINTHNQRNYLARCINSCLNQTYKGKYEIIICDTSSESNEDIIKKKKNLFYYHKKKFSKFPVIDQLFKIHYAFKKSKGDFILLLDGDDFFDRNKLDFASKVINQEEIVFHDLPIYYSEKTGSKKSSSIIFYKKLLFYKRFINNWPIVYGTSCLFFNREILKNFFSLKKIFNFNYLAIDIMIAIFSQKLYKYNIIHKRITYKSIQDYNLDNKYNYIFSKIFWLRRKQQLDYEKYLGFRVINANYILTNLIFFLLINLSRIKKLLFFFKKEKIIKTL
jgi:glycosyltransferase involved in cell wall biosynthesis